jgi:hypothetical protein
MSHLPRVAVQLLSFFVLFGIVWGCSRDEPKQTARSAVAGESPQTVGRWRKARRASEFPDGLTDEQRAEIRRLEAIGYASGSVPAGEARGVTRFDSARAFGGYNLYVSGHASEAVLMDMEGRVLHRWSYPLRDAWPELSLSKVYGDFWRSAQVFPNGDLIAIHEGVGVLKIDAASNLLWKVRNGAHHDLAVLPDGDIYLLTRKARVVPRIHPKDPILEDFITRLGPDGSEKHSFSVLEALERSEYRDAIEGLGAGDLFHTNSIEVLGSGLQGLDPAFAPGNLLVSLLYPNAIGVIDVETETFTWWKTGSWRRQHQPAVLDNGHLMLFDNQGAGEVSRVVELDPVTLEIQWEYQGDPEDPFFTYDCGASSRLPNGNTLITESNNGRAFEITPEGDIVWEFYNPHRAGEQQQLIATLFEMVRLPPDTPIDWAEGGARDAAEAPSGP